MRRLRLPSEPLQVKGTTSAMSKAINMGGRGRRIATRMGEALIRQFGERSVNNSGFYFQLALAYQLLGRRYEGRVAELRAMASECDDYTPELGEAFDRDELLAIIREGIRRRDLARAWELFNQPWPQHEQGDATNRHRQGLLHAIRARFMYALRELENSFSYWSEAWSLWAGLDTQWVCNNRVDYFKLLVRHDRDAHKIELQEIAQEILGDPRCIAEHRRTVWLGLKFGKFGNWLDDKQRQLRARYGF